MRRIPLLLVWLLAVSACGAATEVDHGPATITVDVFSGRPNPAWDLDAAAAAAIVAAWQHLGATGPAEYPGHLGYRGVSADFADGLRLVVTGGVAMASEGTARADTGRALERMLIETGRGRLDAATLDLVLGAIGD